MKNAYIGDKIYTHNLIDNEFIVEVKENKLIIDIRKKGFIPILLKRKDKTLIIGIKKE